MSEPNYPPAFLIPNLVTDTRPIAQVHDPNGGGVYYKVGFDGVARIVIYPETGEYALLPWIAIYLHDETEPRIKLAARQLLIEYEAPPPS